jgi:mono/diheme cytochrome c family protein/uncharacterized membrane protein
MNWHTFTLVGGFSACVILNARAADSSPGSQRDLASEVRDVFAAKCAGCHGPNLAKPKGRFGYILDLNRLANDREKVVPFAPKESELWELVRRDEMPPPDSPSGALTVEQKDIIQAWISAGAPSAVSASSQNSPAERPKGEKDIPSPMAYAIGASLLERVGKLHLLFLHFPIALMIAAAVGEVWAIVVGSRVPSPAVRYCTLLGAIAVSATVPLGWLHALSGNGIDAPHILSLHRWLGTTAGAVVVVAAIFSELDVRRGARRHFTRVLLIGGAVLIALTAHFGGILVHGEDFFR